MCNPKREITSCQEARRAYRTPPLFVTLVAFDIRLAFISQSSARAAQHTSPLSISKNAFRGTKRWSSSFRCFSKWVCSCVPQHIKLSCSTSNTTRPHLVSPFDEHLDQSSSLQDYYELVVEEIQAQQLFVHRLSSWIHQLQPDVSASQLSIAQHVELVELHRLAGSFMSLSQILGPLPAQTFLDDIKYSRDTAQLGLQQQLQRLQKQAARYQNRG